MLRLFSFVGQKSAVAYDGSWCLELMLTEIRQLTRNSMW